MMKLAFAAGAMLVLAGCVSVPRAPDRAEWEQIHTRTFAGKSQKEVLDAAEKVLAAADHDFKFDYPPGKLMARRPWTIYAVVAFTNGTDFWTIETTQADGGTQAMVQVTQQMGTTTASPVFGAGGTTGWGVNSVSTPGNPIQGRPLYDLFWDRVDALLYDKPWITCAQRKAAIKSLPNGEKVGFDSLCGVTTDDKLPN